jgi:hypothetical protein
MDMTDAKTTLVDRVRQKLAWVAIIGGVFVVGFLIGLVPMWLSARGNAAERDAARVQLRQAEITNLLLSATVDAKRGEYETARQEASDFFTRLGAEGENSGSTFLSADQKEKLKPVFADRDNVITMLAQRDPASLDRLTNLYVAYSQAVPTKSAQQANSPANSVK